jgi:hypothetical protein
MKLIVCCLMLARKYGPTVMLTGLRSAKQLGILRNCLLGRIDFEQYGSRCAYNYGRNVTFDLKIMYFR